MAKLKTPLEPISTRVPAGPPIPPIEGHKILGVDSLMFSSLPTMASGADVYVRQFYRDNKLPMRRYLPLRGL